jgi:hypothetical protein
LKHLLIPLIPFLLFLPIHNHNKPDPIHSYFSHKKNQTNNNSFKTFTGLPFYFEKNCGRAKPDINYIVKRPNNSIFISSNRVYFVPNFQSTPSKFGHKNFSSSDFSQLNMILINGNPAAEGIGLNRLSGKVNYICGQEPNRELTNIPVYQSIKYENIYPGIDIVYYNKHNCLEFDFVVQPGSSSDCIELFFSGHDHYEIDPDGNLNFNLAENSYSFKAPYIYQIIDDQKSQIPGGFLKSGAKIKLWTGVYDSTKKLYIDPLIDFSTFLGGSSSDGGNCMTMDEEGNIYIAGTVMSANFPVVNAFQPTRPGGWGDAFICKISNDGSQLIYSTYLGGSNSDNIHGIAVDGSGNVVVVGTTASTDFPLKNALQPNFGGSFVGDAFITKIDASGSNLIFSTYLGGSDAEMGEDIAIDKEGNIIVTGGTWSKDFPVVNAYQSTIGGGTFPQDAFITKLSPSGRQLIFSTYLGGQSLFGDHGKAITVDLSGNIYVSGHTTASNFPVVHPFQAEFGGGSGTGDAFIAKFSHSGNLIYSTYLGGAQDESGNGIAVDRYGNMYITGTTNSSDFPIKNPIHYKGSDMFGSDAYITKLKQDGSDLVYSTYLSGERTDVGYDIQVDHNGNAYVTGYTYSTNFPTIDAPDGKYNDDYYPPYRSDAFITKINPNGDSWVFSTYLGGDQDDEGKGIFIHDNGYIYVTGHTASGTFPVKNSLQEYFGGGKTNEGMPCLDVFLTCFGTKTMPDLNNPTNLSCSIASGTVKLKWDTPEASSASLQTYKIYRSPQTPVKTVETNHIATIDKNINDFLDTITMTGENYFYCVTALYEEGESYPSNEVCAQFTAIDKQNTPLQFNLQQNYPNPFNSGTNIRYYLPANCLVNITVFDLSGRKVETLINEHKPRGQYVIQWSPSELLSGIYFYKIKTAGFTDVRKCVLLR